MKAREAEQSQSRPRRGTQFGRHTNNRERPGGARRGRSTPSQIGGILQSALRGHGIDRKLLQYHFVLHWERIVGPKVAQQTRPSHLRGSTLVVGVRNSIWAQELALLKPVFLKRLQAYGRELGAVTDVHFEVITER